MNTRVILYGGIAAVLFFVMNTETPVDEKKPSVGVDERESLNSLCLEEVIGFDAGIQAKLGFCNCVTQDFAERIDVFHQLKDPQKKAEKKEFGDFFKELVVTHSDMDGDAFEQARALATFNPIGFQPKDKKVAVLVKRFAFEHEHVDLAEAYEKLAKMVKLVWEKSYKSCFQELN